MMQGETAGLRADANKSPLTRAITKAAVYYLSLRGFKPIETEVPVERRWVADVAGVCVPTRTEAEQLKLIPRRKHPEREATYECLPMPLTAIVEVKVTRADFLKDRERKFAFRPAHLCYLSVPCGLLTADEWPAGWFVLEHEREGGGVARLAQQCTTARVEPQACLWLVHEIAVRRHDRTHNRFFRELQAQQRESRGVQRINTALRAVTYWLNRKYGSLQEAFMYCGVRSKLPERTLRDLEQAKAQLLKVSNT